MNNNIQNLFPAVKLYEDTKNNLKEAEKRTNEKPLNTDKTIELEKNENNTY